MQDFFLPGITIPVHQFKHSALSRTAARRRCSVEISGGVQNQLRAGELPVGPVPEGVQQLLFPAARSVSQFEHNSATWVRTVRARRSTLVGCTVNIPCAVEDEAFLWV